MAAVSYKDSDDAKLIAATLSGDRYAFSEIVSRYKDMVAYTVKGMVGEMVVADDIGQEVFIRLYHALGKFRGESKLSTYIHRIAVNVTLNEIKRVRNIPFHTTVDSVGSYNHPSVNDDYSIERSEVKELVERALQHLEPKYRIVVVMRMLQGYDTKETADALGIPLGTVLSRLSRAQKKLRGIIEKLNV